jgi:hypothetical protein
MPASKPKKTSRPAKAKTDQPEVANLGGEHYWRDQLRGLLAGAVIGYMLTILFPGLATSYGTLRVVFWSAVIGGVLGNLDGFIRGGQALTRRSDRRLNLLVGLGVPLVVLSLVWLLVALLGGVSLGGL